MRPFALTFALSLTLISTPVFGEDGARGRLPDGRAFRTDAQGNQLVDYIAELEVNVEQLNRRVIGLEDELSEKRKRLERYQSQYGTTTDLVERDLVDTSGDVSAKSAAVEPRFVGAEQSETEHEEEHEDDVAMACPPANCDPQIASLRSEAENLRLRLDTERKAHAATLSSLKTDKEAGVVELARTHEENLQKLRSAHEQELANMQAQLSDLKGDLDEKSSEYEVLQTKYNSALKDMGEARAKYDHEAMESERLRRAAASSAPIETGLPQRALDARASSSAAKSKAVTSVKESAIGDIQEVRVLVKKRDQLYNQYKLKKQTVQFKPAQPLSSQKHTVDSLSHLIRTADSVSEINSLKREIGEIKQKIADDISLMNRMGRIG